MSSISFMGPILGLQRGVAGKMAGGARCPNVSGPDLCMSHEGVGQGKKATRIGGFFYMLKGLAVSTRDQKLST